MPSTSPASPASAAAAIGNDDARRIVGPWKIVSAAYEDQATKERTPVYGEHPVGYQLATAEGRWIAVVTAEGRKPPQTDAERALALRTMVAYTGRWRVEDRKIKVKVEAAWQESSSRMNLDSMGFVKLGQPVPLSNLSLLSNSGVSLHTEK